MIEPVAPLNLVMERAHLRALVYASSLTRGTAEAAYRARGPFAMSPDAGRLIGLLEQAERRVSALMTPEALIALNAILRAQYEAGQVALSEAVP